MPSIYTFVKEIVNKSKKNKTSITFDAGPIIGVFNPSTLKNTVEAIGKIFSSDALDSITSAFGNIKAEVFQKQYEIIDTINKAETVSKRIKLKQDEYYSDFMLGLNNRVTELLNGLIKDLSDSVIDKVYDEIAKLGDNIPKDWQDGIQQASDILTGKNPQLYMFYKIAALIETGGTSFYLALLTKTRDSLVRELQTVRNFNQLMLDINKDVDAILKASFDYKNKRVDMRHLEDIRRMMIEISEEINVIISNNTLGARSFRKIDRNLESSIQQLVLKISVLKGRQSASIYTTDDNGNDKIDYMRLVPDDIKQAINIAEEFVVKIQQITGSKISGYLLAMCRVCYYSSLMDNYEDIIHKLSKKTSGTLALWDKMRVMKSNVDKVITDISNLKNTPQDRVDSNLWMAKNVKYMREITNIKEYFDRFIAPYTETSIFESPVGNKLTIEGEEFARVVNTISKSSRYGGILYKIGYRSSPLKVSTNVSIDPKFSMIYEIFDYVGFWVNVTTSTLNLGSIFNKSVALNHRKEMIDYKNALLFNITETDNLIRDLQNFPGYQSKELNYVMKSLNKLGYKHSIDFIMSGQLVELLNYGISATKMGIGAIGKVFNQNWNMDFELNEGTLNWVSQKSSNAFYHNEGFIDAVIKTNNVFDNVIDRSVLKDTVGYEIDQATSEYSQYISDKIDTDEKIEEELENVDDIWDYESEQPFFSEE